MKSIENTSKNKALITALYCRLSQEDERLGESLSIENQRMMLEKYARDKGFPNLQFYVDDRYSGANFNRPDFKRMMADIEAGKVGIVIVKDQSRLGRDYLQTGMLMEITFPQYDIRFIAINDGVAATTESATSPESRIILTISMPVTHRKRFVRYREPRGNGESEWERQFHTDI